jgi:addiction module HigA family antidote
MCNPPHPGELLKEDYLIPLGLTITDVAKKLKISRQTLSDFVNGRIGVSPQMALKLAKAFNTSPECWLNHQLQYDLAKAINETNTDDIEVIYKSA